MCQGQLMLFIYSHSICSWFLCFALKKYVRIDDGGKISHRKLEESGVFYVSVAFSRSAHLRNVATAPQSPGAAEEAPGAGSAQSAGS